LLTGVSKSSFVESGSTDAEEAEAAHVTFLSMRCPSACTPRFLSGLPKSWSPTKVLSTSCCFFDDVSASLENGA